jgi:Tol biopolymer transport system component/DNA-binding winged helix-turn-helix (wHTH) protein
MDVRARIVRFGVFELDTEARELRKNGIKIKLQDQPLQILTILLARHGEIVPRDELRAQLWPDGTFVDFDHSLNASINKLRDALGDSASNARFVETVPRRGYRFIAPTEYIEPPASASPVAEAPVKRSTRWNPAVLASAVAIVLSAGAATWWARTKPPEAALEPVPLTSSPGLELQPSFSPDGNYIVYTAMPSLLSKRILFLMQLGSGSARRLTSSEASEVSAKWSPDGRTIAFIRVAGQGRRAEASIITVPAFGGAERSVPHGQIQLRAQAVNDVLLDWCADSEHLVVSDQGTGDTAALFVVNSRTGERRPLTTPPQGGYGDVDPSVSPDGRRLTFTRYTGLVDSARVHLLEWDASFRPTRGHIVQSTGRGSRAAAWMPNGREIVFASGPVHRKRLMRMPVDESSPPRPLPFAAEGTLGLTIAISRQNKAAYPTYHADVGMYRLQLSAPVPREFQPSSFVDHLPEYSHDGRQVAFVSNRSGAQEVWVSKADGSDLHQLTTFGGKPETTWPRWSPDDRHLVVNGGNTVLILDTQGGRARTLTIEGTGEGSSDWSRDGRWLYVTSNRTGRAEIWKTPAEPGNEAKYTQVTKNGGAIPRLSADGAFLYYTKGTMPAELWRIPVDGGEEERVIDRIANTGAFTVARSGVYFIPPVVEEPKVSIMFLDVRTGVMRRIAEFNGLPMWGLTVSPDEKSMLYVGVSDEAKGDLMLVDNFR